MTLTMAIMTVSSTLTGLEGDEGGDKLWEAGTHRLMLIRRSLVIAFAT